MKTDNIGLIAAGKIGRMYGRLINGMPGLCLAMVVDKYQTLDSLRKQGIEAARVTKDLDDLLNDETIDKTIVAASTPSHVELCEALIGKGKHVLCEKPLSFDPGLIKRVGEAAQSKGVLLQIGYVRRFDPHYRELKKRLADLKTGSIHSIKIVNRDPLRPDLKFAEKSGGIFTDFMVHDFDMLQFLTGKKIAKIYVAAKVNIQPELVVMGDFDTVLATAEMEDGILVSLDCSRETRFGYDQRIEVFHQGGCLRVENVEQHRLTAYDEQGVHAALPRWDYRERYREAFRKQLEVFLRCTVNEEPSPVDWKAAALNVETAKACAESVRLDRSIKISCNLV